MPQPRLTRRQRVQRMLFLPLLGAVGIALSLKAGDTLGLIAGCLSFVAGAVVVTLVALPRKGNQ